MTKPIEPVVSGGFEYERFRRFMTDEALAAVRGAKAAGATEVVASDSHGNGENLLIEMFPKDVRIVCSWPRHGEMMAGLDPSFAAAVFVGYHDDESQRRARSYYFERPFHEGRAQWNCGDRIGMNAAYAGALGVPVVFISVDNAAANEVTMRLGSMETVITKKA